MVDPIDHHWVVMVAENEAGPDGFGYTVADKAAFLNGDDGLITSTNPVWLQSVFGVLIGLFEQVGLRTNVTNMVAMACQPGPIAGQQSTTSYGQQMTSEGGRVTL